MKTKYHFLGLGGIGMSGLARILLEKNAEVSGSDQAASYVTEGLEELGAQVFIGHDARYVTKEKTVVYSSGIRHDNPEYQEAVKQQCRLLHRSDLLQELMQGYQTLAVAGTHGKTTTSALLAWVLTESGLDPCVVVGGMIPQFNANARHGSGDYFVAEADESDGTFLKYTPYGAIVTNIGLDHLEHYGSEAALVQAFQTFCSKVVSTENLFWCGDDSRLAALQSVGTCYGTGSQCDLRATNLHQEGWTSSFDIDFEGQHFPHVEVALAGKHNVLNALAVFGLARRLGVDEAQIRAAFKSFKGIKRRCEKIGQEQGVIILDDYAHHPTELRTTLDAIRRAHPEQRLVAVFQPHRYTRTRDCLGTFSGVFDCTDHVIITDIYAAGEDPIPGVTIDRIQKEICAPSDTVPYQELTTFLANFLQPHDVVVTLGAGNVTQIGPSLISRLKKKLKVGLIAGGCSVEHEISLKSAQYIADGLSAGHYDVESFHIDREGNFNNFHALEHCDILFPVLHGPFGEDGCIQGLFEILNKPYVGNDHRASAIAMDKALTKTLAKENGIATSPFFTFAEHDWLENPQAILERIKQQLIFPVFVKAAHLGSSLGVYKVKTEKELPEVIEEALRYDNKLIVENRIAGREMEFGMLGNVNVEVIAIAELCSAGQLCHYDGKYGDNSMPIIAPAPISDACKEEGIKLAKQVYRMVGCAGWARIDFFLDPDGKFWLNEINPIPGCTRTSAFPKICEAAQMKPSELVDRLIALGMQRHRSRNRKENHVAR